MGTFGNRAVYEWDEREAFVPEEVCGFCLAPLERGDEVVALKRDEALSRAAHTDCAEQNIKPEDR